MDPELLVGSWVHSHEEDTADERVYRSRDHPLPPSRGRETLELHGDGTLTMHGPGPTDAPLESTGTWTLDGSDLLLRDGGGSERTTAILRVDADRLVVRP
jgi:hypothetical protein